MRTLTGSITALLAALAVTVVTPVPAFAAPDISVSPTSIDFGTAAYSTSTSYRTVTVTSTGQATLAIYGVSFAGSASSQFQKGADGCTGMSLPPGLSCTFQLRYSPTFWSGGSYSASAVVSSSAGDRSISLTGYETVQEITVSPARIDFGPYAVGASSPDITVTVRSIGTAPANLNVLPTGDNASDFSISSDNCTGTALAPGSICTFRVRFTPTGSGWKWAAVSVSHQRNTHNVFLTGQGDALAPASTFTTANAGVVLSGGAVTGTSTDDASGIAYVRVTYTPVTSLLTASTATATLSCDPVTECEWSAPAPLVPGIYLVNAQATDFIGHTETPGPTITIVVA